MNKVIILGAGESGVGAAILAKKQGADVFVSDAGKITERFLKILSEYQIPFEMEGHTIDKFFEADVIIKSPGIPDKVAVIQQLKVAGIPIISEIEYASRFTKARIIAITGSNGKTTTTSLVFHLLKQAGENAGLGGNIGMSFAKLVAEENHQVYVLEISSFQLDDIQTFKPEIALLLNITPDHLDRYNYDLSSYGKAKLRIAQNQDADDSFIYNLDDEETKNQLADFQPKSKKLGFSMENKAGSRAWTEGEKLIVDGEVAADFSLMKLLGRHNQQNVLAALLAVKAFGLKWEQIQKGLMSFQPIEHRLELVRELEGVRYINDSKATNVDAVAYALEAVKAPIVWLAGGVDKGNDYSEIQALVNEKVKTIVVLGEYSEKFYRDFDVQVRQVMSMDEAITLARQLARPGDTVLLSPACASFDLFENYEDRGKQFKKLVND